jgi:hypothetical protein
MALEPWTSWPGEGLAAAVRQGTALRMGAGETLRTRLCAVLWPGRGPVERITPDGVAPARETPTPGERRADGS